jgi:hypothetical protein
MSAGHRTHHDHSDSQIRELKRLLADERVKKLIKTPYRVDLSHQMPLTGGSTVQWGKFFLDPKLKKTFMIGKKANQDLSPPVLRHEVVEKALRQVFGMSYDRAHIMATVAERLEVEKMGLDWETYKRTMESIVRKDEHEHPKSLPKDYDTGPLRASRGVKSLKWLQKAV